MQHLLKLLRTEDRNLQKLHWSVIAAIAICCCECGCQWWFRGNDIDAKGTLTPPPSATIPHATGLKPTTPPLPATTVKQAPEGDVGVPLKRDTSPSAVTPTVPPLSPIYVPTELYATLVQPS